MQFSVYLFESDAPGEERVLAGVDDWKSSIDVIVFDNFHGVIFILASELLCQINILHLICTPALPHLRVNFGLHINSILAFILFADLYHSIAHLDVLLLWPTHFNRAIKEWVPFFFGRQVA